MRTDALRFVAAHRIENTGLDRGAPVETAAGNRLGRLEGFVVDADARRLRFVVVEASGRYEGHRLLLPFAPARIADGRLRLLSSDMRADLCTESELSEYAAL
jgi:hypothetical protein